MTFSVYAAFKNQFNETIEEKEEATYEWPQAFGAFTIYAADPDCIQCTVTYKDARGLTRLALVYNEVME